MTTTDESDFRSLPLDLDSTVLLTPEMKKLVSGSVDHNLPQTRVTLHPRLHTQTHKKATETSFWKSLCQQPSIVKVAVWKSNFYSYPRLRSSLSSSPPFLSESYLYPVMCIRLIFINHRSRRKRKTFRKTCSRAFDSFAKITRFRTCSEHA